MSFKNVWIVLVGVLATMPVIDVGLAPAETMYAVTDGCGNNACQPASNGIPRLLSVDTVTGAQAVINNNLGTGPLQSLAAMPSGLMYSVSLTGLLIAIDPVTGTATSTGTQLGLTNPVYAMAANANGELYAVSTSPSNSSMAQLYKINPATGATLVGDMGIGRGGYGMDFSPDGTLYVMGFNRLMTVNTTTGAASAFIGPDPNCCGPYSSIAFDSTGKLWASWENDGRVTDVAPPYPASGRLFSINPATSASTLVFDSGLNPTITGIEFLAPVPIPAAVWLFGSGLAAMVGFARKRTRWALIYQDMIKPIS